MKSIQNLIPLIKSYYSSVDPAHDWPHIGRVVANARMLSEGSEINLNNLLAATYCHDLINLPKDHPERREASTLTALEAAPHLLQAGFSRSDVEHIKQVIIEHSYSKGLSPSCIEAAILQDADRLDALGAIGVLRCAAVNTQMKTSFYDSFDPLASARPLDDKNFMLDHYFVKLFELPHRMNTMKGKQEAIRRVDYMKKFIDELMSEVR